MHTKSHKRTPAILSQRRRLFFCLVTGLLLTLILAGAASIPFYFESSSILYKFGFNRVLLLTGQVMGLVAGCLLLVQLVLAARLKFLDRIFGLDRLFAYHRLSGMIIAALVIIHPLTIFIADDRFSIPLQWRYWPEFVGLFLMVLIVLMVVTSRWRVDLGLAFECWWPIHRIAAITAVIAFGLHVLSVNDTFEQRLPQLLAIAGLILCGLILVWMRSRYLRSRRRPLRVSTIESAGADVIRLQLVSDDRPLLSPMHFFPTGEKPTHLGDRHLLRMMLGSCTGKATIAVCTLQCGRFHV